LNEADGGAGQRCLNPHPERREREENCALRDGSHVRNAAVAQCTASAFAGPALAGQAHNLAKSGRAGN